MAMVDVVYVLLTTRPMAQVVRLGPKVVSCLALFCIHCVNQVNSRNDCYRVIVTAPYIILVL